MKICRLCCDSTKWENVECTKQKNNIVFRLLRGMAESSPRLLAIAKEGVKLVLQNFKRGTI